MTLQIVSFSRDHIQEAAALFSGRLAELRKSVPDLPDGMENPGRVTPYLEWILAHGAGVAAMEEGRMAGYLIWMHAENFRDTPKDAAYVPEVAHCSTGGKEGQVYPLLLNKAADCWAEKRYPIWAMTCLANGRFLQDFLFQNGFGMIVQDAVRSIHIPARTPDSRVSIRKCCLQDAGVIAALDAEHCSHYSKPPILMTLRKSETPESIAEFLAGNGSSYWLAEIDGIPAGFMRFEAISHGAARIVRSDRAMAITAAYIQPSYRGRGAAYAMLQNALADYEQQGYITCSVDYETINPQAYGFWTRYFQPVCFSAVRYPEQFQ